MSAWKQQAMLNAPVDQVWELLADPARYPEWSGDTLAVTGSPTRIEKGSTFDITGRGPLKLKATTTFEVVELDEMHELKLRCQTSGYYSHWVLTEAAGGTFADVEFGVDPQPGPQARVAGALHTKRYLHRLVDQTLDGIRGALGRPGSGG
jgi:carbon monoxide dehydrogenase subunit G